MNAETTKRHWEYLRVQVECNKIRSSDETIAELGRQGWELAGVVEASSSWIHMWFKRSQG